MKLQAKKANSVKKKKKILDYLTSGTAQSSQTHSLIYCWSARMFGGGCQQHCLPVVRCRLTFLCQQPVTFWFLAVCCCFFRPMDLVTHTECDWAVMPGKRSVFKRWEVREHKQMYGWEISQIAVLLCCLGWFNAMAYLRLTSYNFQSG